MELEKIGNKFSNACEAQEVINLLKNISENETFIQSLLDEYERDSVPLIGIICMYAEQKKLMLEKEQENILILWKVMDGMLQQILVI